MTLHLNSIILYKANISVYSLTCEGKLLINTCYDVANDKVFQDSMDIYVKVILFSSV